MSEVKNEVRTTVDEKIINKMAEPATREQPVKEEVKNDIQEENNETSEPGGPVYDVPINDNDNNDTTSTEKDEFGNEVAKQKVYTEEEVNELMRQRFNRTKKEEETIKKPQQQTANEPEGEENWEQQLEGFVVNTLKKQTAIEQQKAREQQEQSLMSEFEGKMITSMGRYKDFKEVVGKAPISDPMLLATRQMKDPGAFIYAAAKTQSKELERIAKIQDPYYQAAEMGRLEERMRKVRAGTGSPKPITQVKGDVQNKGYVRPSVDDLVRKDALKKLSNKRY